MILGMTQPGVVAAVLCGERLARDKNYALLPHSERGNVVIYLWTSPLPSSSGRHLSGLTPRVLSVARRGTADSLVVSHLPQSLFIGLAEIVLHRPIEQLQLFTEHRPAARGH